MLRSVARLSFPLLLVLSGCYATTLRYGMDTDGGGIYTARTSTFFWGMLSAGTVNVASYCGQKGIQSVETARSPWGWATLGLYVPMKVSITCAE